MHSRAVCCLPPRPPYSRQQQSAPRLQTHNEPQKYLGELQCLDFCGSPWIICGSPCKPFVAFVIADTQRFNSVGEGTLAWDIAKDAAQPIVCHFRRYDDAELSSKACRTASRLTSALNGFSVETMARAVLHRWHDVSSFSLLCRFDGYSFSLYRSSSFDGYSFHCIVLLRLMVRKGPRRKWRRTR